MILTFATFLRSVSDFCGDIATILGLAGVGLVFLIYFLAFAIGEGLGMGKIN